jgi:hypothetical protein
VLVLGEADLTTADLLTVLAAQKKDVVIGDLERAERSVVRVVFPNVGHVVVLGLLVNCRSKITVAEGAADL